MTAEVVHVDDWTDTEALDLLEAERTIERGLKTFVEVGRALARIRDGRLYRLDYDSFEAYCAERWALSRPRAYQLIQAADVVSTTVDTGYRPPSNEAQARELARVAEGERAEVWREANERANGRPTAALVREVVREHTAPAPQPSPSTPDTTNVPAGRDQESPGSSPISTPDRPGADTPQGGDGGGATRDAGGTPPTAGAPAPRPKPPAWDPAEREAHEADVRRRQDIEAARRTAATFVTTIQAEIATIVTGYRLGERGLVTREQIAQIRNVVDLLEKELDREDG